MPQRQVARWQVARRQTHGGKHGGSGARCHGGRLPAAGGAGSGEAAGATAVSTAAISGSKLGGRCHGKSTGDSPTAAGATASPLATAQRQQVAQKNNKQRAKTNILRAFLFPGLTNPFPRRQILFPKINFSIHASRSPCIRAQKPRFCAREEGKRHRKRRNWHREA